jgi:hypothetical protein
VPDVFDRVREVKVFGAVCVVSSPICAAAGTCLRGGYLRKQTAGKNCARGLQEFSFIHGEKSPLSSSKSFQQFIGATSTGTVTGTPGFSKNNQRIHIILKREFN